MRQGKAHGQPATEPGPSEHRDPPARSRHAGPTPKREGGRDRAGGRRAGLPGHITCRAIPGWLGRPPPTVAVAGQQARAPATPNQAGRAPLALAPPCRLGSAPRQTARARKQAADRQSRRPTVRAGRWLDSIAACRGRPREVKTLTAPTVLPCAPRFQCVVSCHARSVRHLLRATWHATTCHILFRK